MKRSTLQLLGTAIIAFVAGIAVGAYFIPSQTGSQFGGYRIRPTIYAPTTREASSHETTSTTGSSTSTTSYLSFSIRTSERPITITKTFPPTPTSQTCQITVSVSTRGSTYYPVQGSYPTYTLPLDKAVFAQGGPPYSTAIYYYQVTASGYGSVNSITLSVGQVSPFFISIEPSTFQESQSEPPSHLNVHVPSNFLSVYNGDYTTSITGQITGPEVPVVEQYEWCQPTTITLHVYDSGGG